MAQTWAASHYCEILCTTHKVKRADDRVVHEKIKLCLRPIIFCCTSWNFHQFLFKKNQKKSLVCREPIIQKLLLPHPVSLCNTVWVLYYEQGICIVFQETSLFVTNTLYKNENQRTPFSWLNLNFLKKLCTTKKIKILKLSIIQS